MNLVLAIVFRYNTEGKIHERKNDELNCIKIKNDCSVENAVKRTQARNQPGENICKTYMLKEFYPKYIRKFNISTIGKESN